MSTDVLLTQAIEAGKASYPVGLNADDVFELFCSDNILKRYDPTYDQVTDGIVDGPKDGGIDGLYIYVNNQLLAEDTDAAAFKSPVNFEVIIIQSKHQDGFKEGPVDRLSSSLPMLFDPNKPISDLAGLFNDFVIDSIERYRQALGKLVKEFPKIKIDIFYCSKGKAPNKVILAKANTLKTTLTKLANAVVDGASEMPHMAVRARGFELKERL